MTNSQEVRLQKYTFQLQHLDYEKHWVGFAYLVLNDYYTHVLECDEIQKCTMTETKTHLTFGEALTTNSRVIRGEQVKLLGLV